MLVVQETLSTCKHRYQRPLDQHFCKKVHNAQCKHKYLVQESRSSSTFDLTENKYVTDKLGRQAAIPKK